MTKRLSLLAGLAAAVLISSGCSQRVREIGRAPEMSPIGSGVDEGMLAYKSYPERPPASPSRYSLWDDRAHNLYKSSRALKDGDVLTVLISINDNAKFQNKSARSRTNSRDIGLTGVYDINGVGGAASGSGTLNGGSDFAGDGSTVRSENLNLSVAALVTRVLANGNLIIQGSQEVRVNHELRILTIAGIVRPDDIGPDNTIRYERIAEARVTYGGRGRLTEVQQPSWGQQVTDLILPF
ncbi:MAG: flagellar basal body L-ring protein FlgH [Zhengella sp.]|uniref:flagellar basal body L-ring protein FlgH n=1 Tax=Zhengella sp. TaxID=2282762 RepID=UPI001D2FBBE1|nr:flagellar basal body L-ring protein FlgH [Notoacmeibacter sp.]MCC0025469.1 flagellar basal body L-ring protein FlgH [Brucellaceae bacterium]